MKPRSTLRTSLVMAMLLGAVAAAQAQGLTRAQVRAELAEAIRTGDIIVGEHGLTAYEQAPHRYPARPPVIGKTREQVRAELAEAVRTGDIIVGEQGKTLFEQEPHRYPARAVAIGKTREQVRNELALAIRLGDTPVNEQGRTPAERFPSKYAAVRAEHRLAMSAAGAASNVQ